MLVFQERRKPEYPEKNLSEQSREPTTNSTHIWRRVRESNPGHIGGRRALSPLRQLCSPKNWKKKVKLEIISKIIQSTTSYFGNPYSTLFNSLENSFPKQNLDSKVERVCLVTDRRIYFIWLIIVMMFKVIPRSSSFHKNSFPFHLHLHLD